MIESELEFNKKVKDIIMKVVPNYLQKNAFMDRKLTDTPTDNFQVVNRMYVNLSGTVSNRPATSVATLGQRYFATDTNIPMVFDGSKWRNGVGSIVA